MILRKILKKKLLDRPDLACEYNGTFKKNMLYNLVASEKLKCASDSNDTKPEVENFMMRKLLMWVASAFFLISHSAFAILNMELTQGISGAVPIAIVPFSIQGETPNQDVSSIITNDLQNSGRFKVYAANRLTTFPTRANDVQLNYFQKIGVDNIVLGQVQQLGNDRYQVTVQLLDSLKGKASSSIEQAILIDRQFVVQSHELRSLAHHLSDMIYQQITGIKGIFSTRLAYVVVQRSPNGQTRHILEVSDQDGFNPQPLLTSRDPIMSPSWSPNGKQVAYVSFENKHASIYIQNVYTGARRLVSEFQGINGAPAWSPDGNQLALVLSKTGAPNIYVMDLNSLKLTQLTNDYYINTEPAWSPDGRTIVFTSNRSGNMPQIYQINLATRAISRLTYDGKYNARASFTPDGNHIVVLNKDEGLFNIGILDLDSGIFRVLTHSAANNESPSIAPNGTMVLFGTLYKGRNILGMAATDASIQIRLPAPNGDVQDPAWSPFLS